MKHTTFKRIISMVLICMTLVGTLAGFGVSAETAAPTVEIVSNNVRYDDTIRLMYAVKAENLPEGASVTVTLADANGNVYDTIADGTVTIDGVECYKFISKYGVPAQNIDETLTATATVAGTEATDTQEYSVLEYFYERLYVSENVTEEQRTLYNALIEYAKKADIVLNELETSDIDHLAYVVLEGEGAVYTVGEKLELVTDLVPKEGEKIVWSVNGVELTDEEAAAGYTVVAGFANIVAKTVEDEADEPVVPAEPVTTTCTFSSISGSVQYASETHTLAEGLTLSIENCHINTQLRIYSSNANNGQAIIHSEIGVITALAMSAGNKKDTLNVYGSTDGTTWTLIEGVAITSTSYKDYTVSIPEEAGYTYVKLDVAGTSQVRLATLAITTQG